MGFLPEVDPDHPYVLAGQPTATTGALSERLHVNTKLNNIHADVRSDFGAVGNGAADDSTKILDAIDAVSSRGGGSVFFPAGEYRVTQPVLLPDNVVIEAPSGGVQVGAASKITYDGAGDDQLVGPADRDADTINIGVLGVELDGGGLVGAVLDLYRVSESWFKWFPVYGADPTSGVGVLFDNGGGAGKCYRNTAEDVKLDGLVCGARWLNGANANYWLRGKVSGCTSFGMDFQDDSTRNIAAFTDFENGTGRHIRVDSPKQLFLGIGMESCSIGYDIQTLAGYSIIAPTFAGSVTTPLTGPGLGFGTVLGDVGSDVGRAGPPGLAILAALLSGSTNIDFDPYLLAGDGDSTIRFFLHTLTSGAARLRGYKPDGSATRMWELDAQTGNGYLAGNAQIVGAINHDGTTIGLNGSSPVAKSAGWGAPTGTATKTTFATSTVTTAQLAERVKALIDYLTSRGDIGA